MPVSDIARSDTKTADPDVSAADLASIMNEEDVGSVVIELDDRPVGIVTDRDLVLEVLEPTLDPDAVHANDIMTESPATITADEGLFRATELMQSNAVRRIPIVNDDGTIAGIVTLDDVLMLLKEEVGNLSNVIEAESPDF